jgi:hypothetical protein
MLEAEAPLRNSLDERLKTSLAFGPHVEPDERLKELSEKGRQITDRFRESFAAHDRDIQGLMLIELGAALDVLWPRGSDRTDIHE